MKKNYITPEVQALHLTPHHIIALSLGGGSADNSEVLVKDDDWNIWGDDAEDFDD